MIKSNTQKNYLFLALGALAAGLVIRLSQLNPRGLWLDEIWSMIHSAPGISPREVISNAAHDSHPPLFDLLLHYWLTIFGTSEVVAKILPFLFALVSIYVTWLAAYKITGSKVKAYFALGLVSLNFFHLYYSTEVRFYSLMYLLSALTLLQFWNIVNHSALKSYVWFALWGVLLLYTHYYGAILLFVYGIIALTLALMKEISWQNFGRFVIACIVMLLSFSPWLPYMFAKSNSVSWIEIPTVASFFKFMYDYTGKNPVELALYFFALFIGIRCFKTDKKLAVIAYGVVLLTFIVPLIISLTGKSILYNRYLIITLPVLFIFASHVFTERTEKFPKLNLYLPLLLWVTMAGNILFLNKIFKEGKEPWKEVAVFYKQQVSQKQLPLVSEQNEYIDYYLVKSGAEKSVPYTVMSGLSEFWYLKHKRYTSQNSPDIMGNIYVIEQTQQFSHDFELLKVKRIVK
ncbi:glycosyltransferase family 39 protein [Flavobacterium psychrotrophum]|uniref:glycosyltransferase family 39 protein n=1 Tax=Flavobacterium psychrotrophum TaxID=2294119 RepID=UPI000E313259|nr:glycosyltransferase family 39 protein [Flavobacterium psychrotrophum]